MREELRNKLKVQENEALVKHLKIIVEALKEQGFVSSSNKETYDYEFSGKNDAIQLIINDKKPNRTKQVIRSCNVSLSKEPISDTYQQSFDSAPF